MQEIFIKEIFFLHLHVLVHADETAIVNQNFRVLIAKQKMVLKHCFTSQVVVDPLTRAIFMDVLQSHVLRNMGGATLVTWQLIVAFQTSCSPSVTSSIHCITI